MATQFPQALDTFGSTVDITERNFNLEQAVAALQSKVGIASSADTASLDYKVNNISGAGQTATTNITALQKGIKTLPTAITLTPSSHAVAATPDASLGGAVEYVIGSDSAGTAFTLSNPTNPTKGQMLTILVDNSGNANTLTYTYGAALLGGPATLASSKRHAINFIYDGTNWWATGQVATAGY